MKSIFNGAISGRPAQRVIIITRRIHCYRVDRVGMMYVPHVKGQTVKQQAEAMQLLVESNLMEKRRH